MKNLGINSILILVVMSVLYIFYVRECKNPVPCPAEDEIIIKKAVWDSIGSILNKPPIIITDTVYIKDTVYVDKTKPVPQPTDSTFIYNDSLKVENKIDVSIRFESRGLLVGDIEWRYTPIVKEITTIIEKPVPHPVPYIIEHQIYRNGIYVSLGVGGNNNSFMIGSDIDIITKFDYIYGIQYRRFGDQNMYGVKFGIRLNSLFK